MEYSPKKMTALLEKYGFTLKKKFGQNFIIDENVINSIIAKSHVDKETMVIEIGPGAGSLTYKLGLSAKNVLCYEIDETIKELLYYNIGELSNVEVIYKDFLKADVINDLKKYSYSKLYVVANLPYYITTPIIIKIIEDEIPVDKMVVMVQKEVGDRFKAVPGSKDYGSLSVFLDYYFDIKKLIDISSNVFVPKPNVDSIVVEFKKKEEQYELKNSKLFFKLIRDSFTQKRKTLRNNLKGYNLESVEKTLKKHNLDLSVRAEQLPLEIFVEIANNL
ncbi:MAG: 16S rRNA (adenine(1518)-N(6)/adenine(1519)-N(6))-dimethyltransferase RsmA [Firmicutes bacterium]|nr:16S rRNA (adenine(1518)-N(6)/adenine(1519)-N(6))-dimethyltransferase RsmA [Bacillota bacterium]